jgi:hypothetical protein
MPPDARVPDVQAWMFVVWVLGVALAYWYFVGHGGYF